LSTPPSWGGSWDGVPYKNGDAWAYGGVRVLETVRMGTKMGPRMAHLSRVVSQSVQFLLLQKKAQSLIGEYLKLSLIQVDSITQYK
jgi:hypothetical protein